MKGKTGLCHLSLFSGIGGIDLAAEWAGMTTVAFCEQDTFCQKILAKHWPNTPIFNDIHTLTADALAERGINQIDVISGGFPCQPYSDSGRKLGDRDDRALWPEMLRVIKECRPAWVVGENVVGLIKLGAIDGVLASLEAAGYETWPIVLPACAVNARHVRRRVFILAYAQRSNGRKEIRRGKRKTCTHGDQSSAAQVGAQRPKSTERFHESVPFAKRDEAGSIRRGTYGISARMGDRGLMSLHALGNAVMPQQVFPIMQAIAQIEVPL